MGWGVGSWGMCAGVCAAGYAQGRRGAAGYAQGRTGGVRRARRVAAMGRLWGRWCRFLRFWLDVAPRGG